MQLHSESIPLALGKGATKDVLWFYKYAPQSRPLIFRAEAGDELGKFAYGSEATWESQESRLLHPFLLRLNMITTFLVDWDESS